MLLWILAYLQCFGVVNARILNINWNFNWLRQTNLGYADHRETKHPEQRIELLASIFSKLNSISSIGTPCDACKQTLKLLRNNLSENDNPLAAIFYGVCESDNSSLGFFRHICENLHLYRDPQGNDGFSFLPDFANALSELDPDSIDGDYLCHYMFSNACPRPTTPLIDYSQYWPPKPDNQPKAERSNKTFNVLHVSDVHLSANYTEKAPANCLGAMCCDSIVVQNPLEARLPAPKFGHWRCDCPQALLDSAIEDTSNRTGNNYQFALFTGDMVDHNPVFIREDETYIEEERTMRALKTYLGDVPVYPVFGNHDSYPYSQEPPASSKHADRTSFNLELLRKLWSDFGWVNGEASKQVKTTHGGYALEPVRGLKIITLNSNYWYRWNFYNYVNMKDPDPSDIIQFLIDELLDCEKRGLKAWVQAHVAPGGLADEALPPAAAFFAATLERFSDVITGQFFGHTHLDEFSVLYAHNATNKQEKDALGVAWVAPSITPYTDLNPGWRYYEVDTGTFEIMDAYTVFADIEPGFGIEWALAPDLDWRLLYSTREVYGARVGWPETEPLNGKFWHRVAKEILYDENFAEEFVRRSYRHSSRAPQCSDYDCRSERYCYATSMTPDQVANCHEEIHSGERWKAGRLRLGSKGRKKAGLSQIPLHRPSLLSFHGIPSFPMPRPSRFLRKKDEETE